MATNSSEAQKGNKIEIPADVLNPARKWIVNFAVGFAFIALEGNIEDAILAGSGTLVQIDGKFAVLTADHVAEKLPKSGDLGLILVEISGSKRSRFTIDASSVEYVKIGRGMTEDIGPDLGLILLSPQDVERTNAYKAFYNIDKRSIYVLDSMNEYYKGV